MDAILNQKINYSYELVVSAPDKEAEELVKKYKKKNVRFIKDPGKGKSFALNLLFSKLKGDICMFTDGDVYFEKNAVNEFVKVFDNPKIGCAGGRVKSMDSKKDMFGYWSHVLADVGGHQIFRKERARKGQFMEFSGYMFGFRKGIIKKIPLDVAEDSMIPYMCLRKGWKLGYAEKAIVYAKNPTNWADFLKQRKRTADAHTKLDKYYPEFPKVKNLKNEIVKGGLRLFGYASNIKEFFWTFALYFARLYVWLALFYDLRFKKKEYQDGWEKSESTR